MVVEAEAIIDRSSKTRAEARWWLARNQYKIDLEIFVKVEEINAMRISIQSRQMRAQLKRLAQD